MSHPWDRWYDDEGWEHDAHRMTFDKEDTMPREPFGPEWAPLPGREDETARDKERLRLELAAAEMAYEADLPSPEEL